MLGSTSKLGHGRFLTFYPIHHSLIIPSFDVTSTESESLKSVDKGATGQTDKQKYYKTLERFISNLILYAYMLYTLGQKIRFKLILPIDNLKKIRKQNVYWFKSR
jgi:hypothetical protein